MKRKRILIWLLTGILILPMPAGVSAAEFSDGAEEENQENTGADDLFTSGSDNETEPFQSETELPFNASDDAPSEEDEVEKYYSINCLRYTYQEETNTFYLGENTYAGYPDSRELIVQEEILGRKVTEIKEEAFKEYYQLEKLYIPDSVTVIGENLFHENASVTICGAAGSAAEQYAKNHQLSFEEEGEQSRFFNHNGVVYLYDEGSDSYSITGYDETISPELTIPEEINGKSVKRMEAQAFAYCGRLKKITLPGTIDEIDSSAFYMAGALEEVVIGEGTQKIGSNAFYQCTSLKNVILPDSVAEIGDRCFEGCQALENVRLSAGLKIIENYAFADCHMTQTLVLPEGVTNIYSYAFNNFQGEKIVLPDSLVSVAGRVFLGAKLQELIIPDSVTGWGTNVFENADIASLTLGNGMRSVRKQTFKDLKNPKNLVLPDSVVEIGNQAFMDTQLERVFIPSGVTKIHRMAFEGSNDLTLIVEKGSYGETFARANAISYEIGTMDSSVKPDPDEENVLLGGVHYVYQKEKDSYIVKGYGQKVPAELTIRSSVNKKPVISIANNAFSQCKAIEKVNISGSIKQIGKKAFYQCENLTEVRMKPGVQTLGESVFEECWKLRQVELPDTITSIGRAGFCGCHLESLKLPDKLKVLEEDLFLSASVEKKLTIPSRVTHIKTGAFHSFSTGTLIIPDSVTEIEWRTFDYCSINTVLLGSGVRSIRSGTFERSSLREVILSEGVQEIGKHAFNLTTARRINLPKSIKRIHDEAFSGSISLTLYVIPGSYGQSYARSRGIPYDTGDITQAAVVKDGMEYQYQTESDSYILTYADRDLEGNIIVPDRINGKKVTGIGAEAFEMCTRIDSVKLPETVTVIGEAAFSCCTVGEINIPYGITMIPERAFEETQIRSITLPEGLTAIGEGAFTRGCLQEVFLPESLKTIGAWAFANNDQLKSIQLPEGIREIPEKCFGGCDLLDDISIPNELERIGEGAFAGTKISALKLPETLGFIGRSAFENCNELKEITIPGGVKTVFWSTLGNCGSLEKVVFQEGVEVLEDVFTDSTEIKEVYIPDSVYNIELWISSENCTIYGNTGSKAEAYCKRFDIPFISTGIALLEEPQVICEVRQGNTVAAELVKRCDNADLYEFVISDRDDFPESGEYLYMSRNPYNLEEEFTALDKGTYYVFARSVRRLEEGEEEYSSWNGPAEADVSVQAPEKPEILNAEVKDFSVEVTLKSAEGAKGYGIALAGHARTDRVQATKEPADIYKVTKNNKSTTYTFKNLEPGLYYVFARTYTKDADGRNVYSGWSFTENYLKVGNNVLA